MPTDWIVKWEGGGRTFERRCADYAAALAQMVEIDGARIIPPGFDSEALYRLTFADLVAAAAGHRIGCRCCVCGIGLGQAYEQIPGYSWRRDWRTAALKEKHCV